MMCVPFIQLARGSHKNPTAKADKGNMDIIEIVDNQDDDIKDGTSLSVRNTRSCARATTKRAARQTARAAVYAVLGGKGRVAAQAQPCGGEARHGNGAAAETTAARTAERSRAD